MNGVDTAKRKSPMEGGPGATEEGSGAGKGENEGVSRREPELVLEREGSLAPFAENEFVDPRSLRSEAINEATEGRTAKSLET